MEKTERALMARNDLPIMPYTRSNRLLGFMSEMRTDPLDVVMSALRENRRMVRFRIGPISAYFLFEPADIRRVMMDDSNKYTKTTRGYEKLRLLLGNGLVTSEGDFWLRQRRIAQPAFHRKCIDSFAHAMVTAAQDQCERWRSAAYAQSPVDVAEAMSSVTLRIAGETLMSVDMTTEGRLVGEAMSTVLDRFNDLAASLRPWPEYWPSMANFKMWSAVRTLRQITDKIIEERRSSGIQVTDLLGMFMASEDPESGEKMDDLQLRDEILTMLLAGHETTANSLAWTLYLVSKHPHVAQRLENEIDTVLDERSVTIADMKSLTYTKQVIQESLRLYPPVWTVGRQAAEECELGGYKIPKGSYVFMSQYAMHRHPQYWKNPEAFDPNRFAANQPDVDRFVYFPFIRGRRQCIGDRFAEMELMLVLATCIQQFRFSLLPGQKVELDPSVTLRPKMGLE